MTINERIKALRESLNMTQEKFAESLGIKRSTIAAYETGRNEPVDSVISLICRVHNINENWLRNGEGDMNLPDPKEGIDKLAAEYGLNADDKAAIREFAALDKDQRAEVLDFAKKLADALNEQKEEAEAERQMDEDYKREKEYRKDMARKSAGSGSTPA